VLTGGGLAVCDGGVTARSSALRQLKGRYGERIDRRPASLDAQNDVRVEELRPRLLPFAFDRLAAQPHSGGTPDLVLHRGAQIERLEELLLKRVGLSPQFQVLKTVTGIGPILA
jgi:hypothetical protein